ncbi:MAG TPA: RagB/SusD family nutrient uptake outer membrane protein [Chitinophagaceae bacterium]|nr:RagB/SusD family nutrient uptake outer membrane protein [Chitinophagaceae bacterium]
MELLSIGTRIKIMIRKGVHFNKEMVRRIINGGFYNLIALLIFLLLSQTSCKKFVTIGPPKTQLTSASVFSTDATAIAAINGIYSQMMGKSGNFARGGNQSLSFFAGLSSDELKNYSASGNQIQFYDNALTPTNTSVESFVWVPLYSYIYLANSIITGLTDSKDVTASTKKQVEGEAKFIRAFCYFYLINLFGDVPLLTSTDYKITSVASRSGKSEIYQQIVTDLKDAQNLMAKDYSFSNGERIRPNSYAAGALLARIYLFIGDNTNAEIESTSIINNISQYSLLPDLDDVFLKNSNESIWQLLPITPSFNTLEGNIFILTSAPTDAAMDSNLLKAFESGDNRRINWVGVINVGGNAYYFPYKYKVKSSTDLTEYSMVLRLAEQYLIRAEARAHQDNLTGAQDDLNIIRNRAGLPNAAANNKKSLLLAILHERQVELFTEWGHRWLDVKRTGLADSIFTSEKGTSWKSTNALYPIPQYEIQNDPNLSQNPGY